MKSHKLRFKFVIFLLEHLIVLKDECKECLYNLLVRANIDFAALFYSVLFLSETSFT